MNKRILIIEDHAQMRENISLLLELSGYDVDSAPNGRAGLEKATAAPPDLILCDVMMPELDGYGVLAGVRADPDLNGIPFIFLTAKGEKQDLRAGMNLGADDYLTKPVAKADLLNAIAARLKRNEQRSEEHTSELQSQSNLVCRLLLEKKKKNQYNT